MSSFFESKEPTDDQIAAKKLDEAKRQTQERYQSIADMITEAADKETIEIQKDDGKN